MSGAHATYELHTGVLTEDRARYPYGAPIKWSPASAYAVEDIAITRNGNLLVASYDAVSSGLVLEGDTYRPKAAPRLLTYIQTAEGKWELLALGNFNVPEGIPQGVACVGSSS